jgi:hypothetical protein
MPETAFAIGENIKQEVNQNVTATLQIGHVFKESRGAKRAGQGG